MIASSLRSAAAACLLATSVLGQGVDLGRLVNERYVKSEHRIPMRDGVRLFTAVYRPRDASVEVPILLCRTPYGIAPYGEDRLEPWFLGPSDAPEHMIDGYVFVYQDVRGRMMSEGAFVHMGPLRSAAVDGSPSVEGVDERTDAWDTIEWLLGNVSGHDGRVGTWGGSYDGFYAACTALSGHPALRAALVQGPQVDWYFEDFHRNGILCLADAFDFLSSWGWPHANPTSDPGPRHEPDAEDAYAFFLEAGTPFQLAERHFGGAVAFWRDLASHPNRDAFWRARDLLPHVEAVGCEVLVVGGWYDHNNLRGTLALHRAWTAAGGASAARLVIGPWAHAGWQDRRSERLGGIDFGEPTALRYRETIEIPFLRSALRAGQGSGEPLPAVHAFDTGSLEWRVFPAWPPVTSTRALFLSSSGRLVRERQAPADAAGGGSDALLSDPADPVPAWHGPPLQVPETYVAADQRFVEGRHDVLTYRSEVLERPLTVAGPVRVELHVSSDEAKDAAFVVKLIDEEPPRAGEEGGFAGLVRWGVMTVRHRDGFERPHPLVRGEIAGLRFELLDVLHTFAPGHRIQVQVQPSLFPILARQPHAWVENPLVACPDDYVEAVLRVHRSGEHASRLSFGVLPVPVAPREVDR